MPEADNSKEKQPAPDVGKLLADGFAAIKADLKADMEKLNARIMPQKEQAPKKVTTEDELADMVLLDPKKAVQEIKNQLRTEIMGSVSSEIMAKDDFNAKYTELMGMYPEIADEKSDLHIRTKELFGSFSAGK